MRHAIVFVIDELGIGGAQRQLSLLAPRLPDRYRPVVVSLSRRVDPFGPALEAAGVEVIALERSGHVDMRRLWRLQRIIGRLRARLVHGFLDAANAYAYLAARFHRVPVLLSLRNERVLLPGTKGRIAERMFRRCDGVVVNSRRGERTLHERLGVPDARIHYLRNGIDPPPDTVARPGSSPVVGYIGRFSAQKRLHLLIEAFAHVRAGKPEARLVLMGEGVEEDALRRSVAQRDLADSVEFLAPAADVSAVLGRFRCFALTSAYEGLPNAAMEAVAQGVPLVATAAGDVEDLIVEGETGLLVRDDEPRAIASAISTALDDTGLCDRAWTAGPALVRRAFSIETSARRLSAIYDQWIE